MRELHDVLQRSAGRRWKRNLPLEEFVFDRWERARRLGFGQRASIYYNTYVYGNVTVGEGTWIGPFVLLEGSAGIRIGRFCSVSAGVHIYTHDSVKWALSGGTADYERAPVTIGDCCYIGSQSIVARGVTIGHHSIIGAGSFVNRDIPSYSVAAGSPCKVIGRVQIRGGTITLVPRPSGARKKSPRKTSRKVRT